MNESINHTLSRIGKKGATLQQLAEATGVDTADLLVQLKQLQSEGECIEWSNRWVSIGKSEWSVGIIRRLERGDSLVLAEARGDATYFVSQRELSGARDGDLVAVRPLQRGGGSGRNGGRRGGGSGGRSGGSLPEAKVGKVLKRAHQRMVGIVVEAGPWTLVKPLDPRLRLEIWLADVELDVDSVVETNLTERNFRSGVVGELVKVLGALADPASDTATVIAQYELPEAFSEATLAMVAELPTDPDPSDGQQRKDLRTLPTLTIDGADAKDFDDAISLERKGSGYRLWVHIADVAHYVQLDSPIDLDARLRGTSVYFAGRVVPMIPERLSNGLCSLRPGVPRLTMTAQLDFDGAGQLVARKIFPSVIQSDRRSTYDEVNRYLDRQEIKGITGTALSETLTIANELLEHRLKDRRERGAIDLEIPESRVEVNQKGVPVAIHRLSRGRAHRLIEEFMLAANEAVATELEMSEIESVHRVHPPPDPAAVEELATALRALGLEAPQGLESLHPEGLQRLLSQAEERQVESVVGRLILRSLQRAYYAHDSLGHFALALRHYTHFTSPIRRYPDLLVHRSLKAHGSAEAAGPSSASKEAGFGTQEVSPASQYEELAAHSSQTERRAERAERELTLVKKLRYLGDAQGECHQGTIVGVAKVGLFVELDDLIVDGVVQRSVLSDDRYQLEPENFRWIGLRHGRTFTLGDRLEVEIKRVSIAFRRLDLGIPDMPEPFRDRRGRSPGQRGSVSSGGSGGGSGGSSKGNSGSSKRRNDSKGSGNKSGRNRPSKRR